MTEQPPSTDTPTDRLDDLSASALEGTSDVERSTPVEPEPVDHDGVMEVGDVHDGRVDDAMVAESWSPPERERHVGRVGLVPSEQGRPETFDERLAEEEPDVAAGGGGDLGAGTESFPADEDTDGELLDDEVGRVRAGRLVDPSQGGGPDVEPDEIASDVGTDGGAASAEEAAVHIVEEGDGDLDPLPDADQPAH